MTEQNFFASRNLNCSCADVLRALVGLARVQVSVRTALVLHERQGEIEKIHEVGEKIFIQGEFQDSWIDTAAIQRIIAQEDVSRHGRSLPRITLLGAQGVPLLTVTALGDGRAFLNAIGNLPASDADPVPAWARPVTPASEKDAGFFELQKHAGKEISILMEIAGAKSSWSGILDEARIGENFINVSRPGFHSHLRGGAVTRWEKEGNRLSAIGNDAQPLGLVVEGVTP